MKTKALELFFSKYHLGLLTQTDDGFIYDSNVPGEQDALAEHLIINGYENMFGNVEKHYTSLPPVFATAYQEIMLGAETIQDLGVSPSDTPFDILFAQAGSEQEDSGFHFGRAFVENDNLYQD